MVFQDPRIDDPSARVVPGDGAVLELDGLGVRFGALEVVSGLSLSVRSGETLAIVGESGSGKSVANLAILGLNGPKARVDGAIRYHGRAGKMADLATAPEAALRALRGDEIAMIFQEPMTSLNPVLRVGTQLVEVLQNHGSVAPDAARERALETLQLVGIPDPEARLRAYPHELSGGMRQRVMIAMALMRTPRLLIADEPTTALDVTIQAQILDLLRRLQRKLQMAMIFITHDLGVVAEIADRVAVMYSGRVVEEGPVAALLANPRHPYTRGLIGSLPRMAADGSRLPLQPIGGTIPDLAAPPPGCRFHPRCAHAVPGRCDSREPALEPAGEGRTTRCLRWREIPGMEAGA